MLSHKLDNGVLLAFGTPILSGALRAHARIGPLLRAAVLACEQREAGLTRSNFGGWHSKYDLFEWHEPGIAELRSAIETLTYRMMSTISGRPTDDLTMELKVAGWANVSREGAYNRPHQHHGVMWSGIYYLDAGKPNPDWRDSGLLEVYDPRLNPDLLAGLGLPQKEYIRFTPESGMILLFPAWLSHFVHPYHGPGERISIAFDVNIRSLKLREPASAPAAPARTG